MPRRRPRGSKGAGLRYERLVAGHFRGALHGQWYKFIDAYGMGYCQPDLVLIMESSILVFECKLSDTPAAEAQLEDLYFPVLAKAYRKPVSGIIVAKFLRPQTDLSRVATCFDDALFTAGIPILHWMGKGPLL